MAGEGNRIWSPRLMRLFLAVAFVLLLVFLASRFFNSALSVEDRMSIGERIAAIDSSNDQTAKQALQNDPPILDSPLDPVLVVAREALAHMQSTVYDYTAVFQKQERIDGKLHDPQTMEMKVLCGEKSGDSVQQIPLHAYLRVIDPSKYAGREIIWIDGRNENKLIAHEAGFMNLIRVQLDPKGSLAMSGSKYSIDQIGLENLLKKLIERGEKARSVKECIVDIQHDFIWEGKQYTRILVTSPNKSRAIDFHTAEILFDPALKLPVSYSAHLWPASGTEELPLEERYVYRELKVNVGLTEEDFNPDNPSYKYP